MRETDHGLALRGGIIARMLVDPAVSARCEDRIYGKTPPVPIPGWPFGRVELGDARPEEGSGWIGEDRIGTVNFFVRPTDELPDAEAEAEKLMKVGKKALSVPLTLELEPGETGPTPYVLEFRVRSSIVRSDRDEPGAYHARIEFSALTAEEA